MKKAIPLILICLLFTSCATLSNMFPAPETPEEKIVYAKIVIKAASYSVGDLLDAKLMTSSQAKEYRIQKDRAKKTLTLYQLYINQGKMISANDQWRLLDTVLDELKKQYILKGVNNDGDISSGSIINIE